MCVSFTALSPALGILFSTVSVIYWEKNSVPFVCIMPYNCKAPLVSSSLI